MEKIKVLIVDDRDIIRDSLKLILKGSNDIIIEDEASDGHEAISLIKNKNYDVVLMDINMPNMNGVEATKKILKIKPTIKILANSFHLNAIHIRDMINAGVLGFIKKGESKKNYINAIKTVAKGAAFLSDEINYKVYQEASSYLRYSSENKIL